MASVREDLTRALRVDKSGRSLGVIRAEEITDPENAKYDYLCADCHERGHRVRLQFRRQSEAHATLEKFSPFTGAQKLDPGGEPLTRDIRTPLSARFNRWAGEPLHRCDNPVRYAPLRQVARRLNALHDHDLSYVFPVHVAGRAIHTEDTRRDIRTPVRPKNMGYNRIETAADMIRLLDVLREDPGLHLFQSFDDGLSRRPFAAFYYEGPQKLYADLKAENLCGRGKSRMVACLVDANTSAQALRDPAVRGCVIDRSMPKLSDGEKLKLLVRPMNGKAEQELFTAARKGTYEKNHLLVMGEAFLSEGDQAQVEIEVFNPSQFAPWKTDFRFLPKVKPEQAAQPAFL